ncbi:MAG: hypothetical protein GX600_11580 [Dehalococcoidia bacterium]|nr:hypothetical protein [Dehalococcoidia bacterium]
MELLPLDSWQVDNLRLTLYSDTPIDVSATKWWKTVTNESPESVTLMERESVVQEHGPWKGVRLVTTTRSNRVDWVACGPIQAEEQSPPALPTIGSFTQLLTPFCEMADTWLSGAECPHPRRLAFGAVLLLPVASPVLGLAQLQPYLPNIVIDPDNSADFFFQINRPRTIRVEGDDEIGVNRLTKWSVPALRVVGFSAEGSNLFPLANRPTLYACRLELDISTAADRIKELPGSSTTLYSKLVEIGLELAKCGDKVDQ